MDGDHSSPPPFETSSSPSRPPNPPAADNGAPEARRSIEIKLVDTAKNELVFRLRPTTSLDKVMDGYCKHYGKTQNSIRFLFDGKRVCARDTPNGLEMEDGDVVDVVDMMIGGGRSIVSF